MKYFHCSRLHFKPGDIIDPKNYGKEYVWVNISKTPHYTLYEFGERSIGKQKYRLYQVRPLKGAKIRKGLWDEIMIKGAVEVLANFGESSKNGKGTYVKRKRGKFISLKMYNH